MTCTMAANPMIGGAVNFEFSPANYASANAGQLAGYGCRGESNGPLAASGHALVGGKYLRKGNKHHRSKSRSRSRQRGGNSFYDLTGKPNFLTGPNSGYGDVKYIQDSARGVNQTLFPSQLSSLLQNGGAKSKRKGYRKQVGCSKYTLKRGRKSVFSKTKSMLGKSMLGKSMLGKTMRKGMRKVMRFNMRKSRRGGMLINKTKKLLPGSLRRHLGMKGGSGNLSLDYGNFSTQKYAFSPGHVEGGSLSALANPMPIDAVKGCETVHR